MTRLERRGPPDAFTEATSYEAMLQSVARSGCLRARARPELKNPDPLRFGWCHGSIDLPREQNYPRSSARRRLKEQRAIAGGRRWISQPARSATTTSTDAHVPLGSVRRIAFKLPIPTNLNAKRQIRHPLSCLFLQIQHETRRLEFIVTCGIQR